MGRTQGKRKGTQHPTQCTDTDTSRMVILSLRILKLIRAFGAHNAITYCFTYSCAGTLPRWEWSNEQLLHKSLLSTSDSVPVPERDRSISYRNGKLNGPLSQITADEGLATYTTEHHIITGADRSRSAEAEHWSRSANSEFSDERPINITDETSHVASPPTNSEHIIRQEWTNPQYLNRLNKICTGLQPLPPPPYCSSLHAHSTKHYHLQLSMLNNIPDSKCSEHSGEQPANEVLQPPIDEGKRSKQTWYYADMERGPLYYKSHCACNTFCDHSIQETFQQPGEQEPVLSHSNRSSYCNRYTLTQLNTIERPGLYIKPFIGLAPE